MKRVIAAVFGVLTAFAATCVSSGQQVARENRDLAFVTIHEARRGRSAMYAQFTRLKNGDLLCAFRDSQLGRDAKGHTDSDPWVVPGSRILCVRSPDDGRTWSTTAVCIFQDKEGFAYTSQGGRGYQAADGTILVPFYVCNPTANQERQDDPLHQISSYMARSSDDGRTWKSEKLPSEFFTTSLYGGIYRLDDGALWMAQGAGGYQRTLAQAKEMSARGEKGGRICRRLVQSTDDGKTWTHYACLGYDPTRPKATAHLPGALELQEPSLVKLPSGKVLMVARPLMHKGVSLDRGRSWKIGPSTLTRSGPSGLCPSMCYSKAGPPRGAIVLAYHDRWGEHSSRGGVYISFSHDEGRSWGHPTFIDGGAYPCVYELHQNGGAFLCAYYYSSSLLKGVFFSIPFPTGIRAAPARGDARRAAITVQWDPYVGEDSGQYEYRLYRSTQAGFRQEDTKPVFSARAVRAYEDSAVNKGQTYYYRVAACRNGEIVSRSWEVSATAGAAAVSSRN